MDVKTFEAFSMKDAIKALKKDLGSDAVILSTKEKSAPGGKGVVFELTAVSAKNTRTLGAQRIPDYSVQTSDAVQEAVMKNHLLLQELMERSVSARRVMGMESSLSEIKTVLYDLIQKNDDSALAKLPDDLYKVIKQLKVMGVEDAYLTDASKYLKNLPSNRDTDAPDLHANEKYYQSQLIRWMMKYIKIAPKWDVSSENCPVQVFVGSNGVGKSSVVAKIASHYHSKGKRKVHVVSLDHSRLAASEQMRVFCKVTDIPFTSTDDVANITKLLNGKERPELVLVDCAGVNTKQGGVDHMQRLLTKMHVPTEFNLCLAATERQNQLEQAIRCFSTVGINSLVFTKLDESVNYGEIFNICKRWALPLSYFSIGTEIPTDLERASRERIIERIFGI